MKPRSLKRTRPMTLADIARQTDPRIAAGIVAQHDHLEAIGPPFGPCGYWTDDAVRAWKRRHPLRKPAP